MDTAQVIDGAINHIETVGWCQGNLYDDKTGAACLRGALFVGAGSRFKKYKDGLAKEYYFGMDDTDLDFEAYRAADDKVKRILNPNSDADAVPGWNDSKNTTKEDVIELLRKAR